MTHCSTAVSAVVDSSMSLAILLCDVGSCFGLVLAASAAGSCFGFVGLLRPSPQLTASALDNFVN